MKTTKISKSDPCSDTERHQKMIEDNFRTLSYKKAIEDNVKKDDIVLDIGCGTGILSFFAAKKGCKRVYAVDNSDIIDCAKETAKLNNLEEDIEFVKKDILKFKPREKISVIIHEIIGLFLWDEDVVSLVAYVRDNFLKKGGILIPSKIDLYLVPTDHKSDLERSVSFWSKKRYGIDFSNLSTKTFMQKASKAVHPSIVDLKDTKTFLCKEKLV